MSCPDWRRLDPAARDAPAGNAAAVKPAGKAAAMKVLEAARWQEALRHLESGCPRCWQEALAVDPTLVFRRLPTPELGPTQEAAEIEAARLAVQAMRTASRLEHPAFGANRSLRSLRSLRALPSHHAARWTLAAGLTAMALVFGSAGHTGNSWRAPARPGTATAASTADIASLAGVADRRVDLAAPARFVRADSPAALGAAALPASSRPSIEGLSRPEARVYQLDSPHMSVVMIVDAKLDV